MVKLVWQEAKNFFRKNNTLNKKTIFTRIDEALDRIDIHTYRKFFLKCRTFCEAYKNPHATSTNVYKIIQH